MLCSGRTARRPLDCSLGGAATSGLVAPPPPMPKESALSAMSRSKWADRLHRPKIRRIHAHERRGASPSTPSNATCAAARRWSPSSVTPRASARRGGNFLKGRHDDATNAVLAASSSPAGSARYMNPVPPKPLPEQPDPSLAQNRFFTETGEWVATPHPLRQEDTHAFTPPKSAVPPRERLRSIPLRFLQFGSRSVDRRSPEKLRTIRFRHDGPDQ